MTTTVRWDRWETGPRRPCVTWHTGRREDHETNHRRHRGGRGHGARARRLHAGNGSLRFNGCHRGVDHVDHVDPCRQCSHWPGTHHHPSIGLQIRSHGHPDHRSRHLFDPAASRIPVRGGTDLAQQRRLAERLGEREQSADGHRIRQPPVFLQFRSDSELLELQIPGSTRSTRAMWLPAAWPFSCPVR